MIFARKLISGCEDFNDLMNLGNIQFPFHKELVVLLETGRIFKGISKNSIGWIFSEWANRPMQEDLSVAT